MQDETNRVVKKKNNNLLIIVISLVIIIGIICFLIFNNKSSDSDLSPKNGNLTDVNYTITKEEAEMFLNDIVPDSVEPNILGNIKGNEDIFVRCIQYLVYNKKYVTKDENVYTFKQEDINNLARRYFMVDNFDYVQSRETIQVKYDSTNKTVIVTMLFSIFNENLKLKKSKEINEFKFDNGIANVKYKVKTNYSEPLKYPNGETVTEETVDYNIKLIKVNDELRIKEISSEDI